MGEFASLSQSVMQLTNIVSDGMSNLTKIEKTPSIAEDTSASDFSTSGSSEKSHATD
jgi:hypothetical protein